MSFLSFISLGHGVKAKVETLSEEDKAFFAEHFPKAEDSWYGTPIMADEEDCQWLLAHGFDVELKRLKGLTGLRERYVPEQHRNAGSVHVHVPNIGLLSMNEVMLQEDCCTDELQSCLDDGWRIIAVCPPNSTRRPDYIMGRTKEEGS
jgi:hypothetical protein